MKYSESLSIEKEPDQIPNQIDLSQVKTLRRLTHMCEVQSYDLKKHES